MDELERTIAYNVDYRYQEEVERLDDYIKQLERRVVCADGISDGLEGEELKKVLEDKVKVYLTGIRKRLLREYNMTVPRINAAMASWYIKLYLEAALKLGHYKRVRLLLYIVRYTDLSPLYKDYLYNSAHSSMGMTLGERRKKIADYRDSLVNDVKDDLMFKYNLSSEQALEAISGWYIKESLDEDLENADIDSAQICMHYRDSLYAEECYLIYMGFSYELSSYKCHYGGGDLTWKVRLEYMRFVRHVLFNIYYLSKADMEKGLKDFRLEERVLLEDEKEGEEPYALYKLMHRPAIELCREIAEHIWEEKKY